MEVPRRDVLLNGLKTEPDFEVLPSDGIERVEVSSLDFADPGAVSRALKSVVKSRASIVFWIGDLEMPPPCEWRDGRLSPRRSGSSSPRRKENDDAR